MDVSIVIIQYLEDWSQFSVATMSMLFLEIL